MLGVFSLWYFLFGPIRHLIKGQEHLNRSYAKVRQRLEMPEDEKRNDFWSYILRHNDQKGECYVCQEMEVNGALFIPTGSDTVSTTLASCIYHLLKYPETIERLRNDLQLAFKSEADITVASVSSLPYLKAVIDEALRLYPPLSSGDMRREVPREGAVVCGQYLPGWHNHLCPASGRIQCSQFCAPEAVCARAVVSFGRAAPMG